MKTIKLLIALLLGQFFSVQFVFATDTLTSSKSYFYQAKQELVNMLEGKKSLSYEQAITTIENAYLGNQVDISFFNYSVDLHLKNIQRLIDANRDYSSQDFKRTLLETEEQKKAKYERSLANWAIFSYMTDTTFFVGQDKLFYNLPYSYSTNDPLGTIDWSNTQVFNLLDTKKGNCFALVSLFKIFAERLNSQANICTAPGHIYIRHADHKGIYHNVELATRAFPGTGSMETLTYTTDDATKNGISLRELDLKQSVALCLIYLAKGYEYKFNAKDDNFLLECAELALKYDSLNLNAMLLKAEVLEARIISKNKSVDQLQKDKDFIEYENFITRLFSLGYREMPMEMKNLVISRLRNEDTPYPLKDHTPKPNAYLGVKNDRYFTLSGGLFDEMMLTKPIEQYHRTHFDTKKKKISKFVPVDTTYNKYPIDLVVFAWQIDPLAHMYPHISPYAAFANNPIYYIDTDGRKIRPTNSKAKQTLETSFDKVFENFPEIRGRIQHTSIGTPKGSNQPVSAFTYEGDAKDDNGQTLSISKARNIIKQSNLSKEEKLTAIAYLNAINNTDVYEFQVAYNPESEQNYGVLTKNSAAADFAGKSQSLYNRGENTEKVIRDASASDAGEAEFRYFFNETNTEIPMPNSNYGMKVIGLYNALPSTNGNETQSMMKNLIFHMSGGASYTSGGVKHSVDEQGNFSEKKLDK